MSRVCGKGNGRPCLTGVATPPGPGQSSGGESGSACGLADHRESRSLGWEGGHRQQVTNVTTIACGPPVALKRISGNFKRSCCMTWEAKWSVSGEMAGETRSGQVCYQEAKPVPVKAHMSMRSRPPDSSAEQLVQRRQWPANR